MLLELADFFSCRACMYKNRDVLLRYGDASDANVLGHLIFQILIILSLRSYLVNDQNDLTENNYIRVKFFKIEHLRGNILKLRKNIKFLFASNSRSQGT
jgi:hypothetical protein